MPFRGNESRRLPVTDAGGKRVGLQSLDLLRFEDVPELLSDELVIIGRLVRGEEPDILGALSPMTRGSKYRARSLSVTE